MTRYRTIPCPHCRNKLGTFLVRKAPHVPVNTQCAHCERWWYVQVFTGAVFGWADLFVRVREMLFAPREEDNA